MSIHTSLVFIDPGPGQGSKGSSNKLRSAGLKPGGNCLPVHQGLASIEGPLIPGLSSYLRAFTSRQRDQGSVLLMKYCPMLSKTKNLYRSKLRSVRYRSMINVSTDPRSYRLESFESSFPPHKRIKDKTNKLLPVVCYAGPVLALVNRLRRGHLRKLYPCYSVYTHSLTTTDTGSILPCTVANRSGISLNRVKTMRSAWCDTPIEICAINLNT